MHVEKILNKLRPLMPDRVARWVRTLELTDPETRSLLEKQIISTAYQVLGDFHHKPLLSLPPPDKAQGAIQLGTLLYDQPRGPLGISSAELLQNMAILGRSGAGKTNVTFHLLAQLIQRKIPFVYLDWKRTARHLIPNFEHQLDIYTPGRSIAPLPFNPFVVPPETEPNVYANQVVDVMSQAFTLGDGSRSIVRKAIVMLYEQGNLSPSVKEITQEVQKIPNTGRIGTWKITAMRALETLDFANITSKDPLSQEQLTQRLLHQNTVIELDALSQESKKFLIPLLCQWLYSVRLKSPDREKLKLVIFIEEAHHVLHKHAQTSHETLLEMLMRQCRELGIGMVVVDQHPHLLSAAALGNTYTTVCLNQKDPSDINKAAAISLLDNDDKNTFSRLPVGQAVIKLQDRWPQPFLVQFPLMPVQKGIVSDAMLARYFALQQRNTSHSTRTTSLLPKFDQVPRIPLFDSPLDQPAFALIQDVHQHPQDGVKARYQRLGLSIGAGNRLKQQLIRQHWLEEQVVNLGQTRKVVLRLTQQAKKSLGLEATAPSNHGSIVHEYWKRFYSQRFREQGYEIHFEVPRRSGRVDLVAIKDNQRIAVEIETGKSDFIRNLRQNLAAGYNQIVIVATNQPAFEKIQSGLARIGLLGLERIQVRLAYEE